MRQFYRMLADNETPAICNFEAPVRKFVMTAGRGCYVEIPYSDGTYSNMFYVPGNTCIYFDLQSVNGGKGCTSIAVVSGEATKAGAYISIVEYGSDGDNDWYK